MGWAGQVAHVQTAEQKGPDWITRYMGYYRNRVRASGLDLSGPGQGLVGFCKYGNESLNFIKDGEFSDYLMTIRLLGTLTHRMCKDIHTHTKKHIRRI
jgi:hypothetical protein